MKKVIFWLIVLGVLAFLGFYNKEALLMKFDAMAGEKISAPHVRVVVPRGWSGSCRLNIGDVGQYSYRTVVKIVTSENKTIKLCFWQTALSEHVWGKKYGKDMIERKSVCGRTVWKTTCKVDGFDTAYLVILKDVKVELLSSAPEQDVNKIIGLMK